MKGLLVGVDAGGTSTRALALDPETGERRTALADGANWTVHGPEICRERIGAAVAEAAQGGRIRSLAVCAAGYYPPDHQAAAEAWAAETWPEVNRRSLRTDVQAAWAGAFGGEPGVVVICGTGSVAYGRNAKGDEARAGGWGPLFSDEGSAYWIALRTLSMLAGWVDTRQAEQPLARRLMDRWPELGADPTSWIRGVYRLGWGREQIAALAGEVVAAYNEADDEAAWEVLSEAADHLARLANTVLEALGGPLPCVLQGGLAASWDLSAGTFAQSLVDWHHGTDIEVRDPLFTPLEGALLLAAETPALRKRVRQMLSE